MRDVSLTRLLRVLAREWVVALAALIAVAVALAATVVLIAWPVLYAVYTQPALGGWVEVTMAVWLVVLGTALIALMRVARTAEAETDA